MTPAGVVLLCVAAVIVVIVVVLLLAARARNRKRRASTASAAKRTHSATAADDPGHAHRADASAAAPAAPPGPDAQAGADTQQLVGFGPQTSSLPMLTPEMLAAAQRGDTPEAATRTRAGGQADGAPGTGEAPGEDGGFGNRAFGFFGAVTSAISIVPQVGRGRGEPREGQGPAARH